MTLLVYRLVASPHTGGDFISPRNVNYRYLNPARRAIRLRHQKRPLVGKLPRLQDISGMAGN